MADPEETTGTGGEEGESRAGAEGDVDPWVSTKLAQLDERGIHHDEWLGALEARLEAAEQKLALQADLGQNYNRLDAQMSGLQAAFEDHGHGGESGLPDVEVEAVEGSLGTFESGTQLVVNGRRVMVVGPASEGRVKVRDTRGGTDYLPASVVPDEVLS